MHGLSKAVQTLFDSRLKDKYHFSKINITRNSKILKTLFALIKSRADLIYFTPAQSRGGNLRDLFLMKIVQVRKKPCLIHIHGGHYRELVDHGMPLWQKRINYSMVSKLAGGIVLGNSLRYILEGMLPNDRIFVCPNCVDDEFISTDIAEKMNQLKNAKQLNILYLSNFIPSKGYREVLALAKLAQSCDDGQKFIFHFAGKFYSKEEEDYFFKTSKSLTNVKYHGIVGGKEKIKLLNICNIFILLTRYPIEGQPISILEAMGNGMAIVTTNHAGIPEIAGPTNGFVCDKKHIDLNAIHKYLLDCYQHREKLIDVCSLNYKSTKQKYTERQYINNMDKIFETVCNRIK